MITNQNELIALHINTSIKQLEAVEKYDDRLSEIINQLAKIKKDYPDNKLQLHFSFIRQLKAQYDS